MRVQGNAAAFAFRTERETVPRAGAHARARHTAPETRARDNQRIGSRLTSAIFRGRAGPGPATRCGAVADDAKRCRSAIAASTLNPKHHDQAEARPAARRNEKWELETRGDTARGGPGRRTTPRKGKQSPRA